MVSKEDLEFLKERLEYFPDTGVLKYKWLPFKKALIGRELPQGPTDRGYRTVVFERDGKKFKRHIICYCLGNNKTIKEGDVVDHVNRVKYDDRLENLRVATRSQNMMNRGYLKGNKLEEKCIYLTSRGKYRVSVSSGGHRHDFGSHADLETARNIRDKALIKLHGEFSTVEERMNNESDCFERPGELRQRRDR